MALPAPLPSPAPLAHYPLAAEQRGMWFVQALNPACGAYNLVFSFEARTGDGLAISPVQLLADLMAEHPILRTSLPASEGGPQQVVWDRLEPVVLHHDASRLDAAPLRERVRQDTRLPFDLSRPPLWRVHTYALGPSRHVVAVVMHHALIDFWSMGLLVQSVGARFGLTDPLSEPIDGRGFGPHALAQQRRLADPGTLKAAIGHWKKTLSGAPPVHGIPLDFPRQPVQHHDGRSLRFAVPALVTDGLKALARQAAATPFMTILAAYFVLIHRYSGDSDVVVVSPVAGRLSRSLRSTLGQFVNTVAWRQQIDGGASFTELLQQVKLTVIEGLRHQECPFSTVVEQVAPQRDASYSPLSQLAFAWERLPLMQGLENFLMPVEGLSGRAGQGVEVHPFITPQQEGQMDLTLEMGGEHEGQWVGVLKYNHHLFDDLTVQGMVQAWVALLSHIAESPQTAVDLLRLGSAEQTEAWQAMGRGPVRDLPSGSVLQQIVCQAERTPDAIAVSDLRQRISYRELCTQAERVGAQLAGLGVQPGDRVGLMLDRTALLPVAILGIWHLGAAYVPLDPALPPDRLLDIAQDAQIGAWVSTSDLQASWPFTVSTVPTVSLDLPVPDVTPVTVPPCPPALAVRPAYMIYTSGSTGQPKGVQVGQRSVANLFMAMQEWLQFSATTRLLAVTTPAFDISVVELLMPLLHGGTVVVCDRATTLDGFALARRIRDEAINVFQATPSTWQLLLYAGWSGAKHLTALCTGEPLPPALAESLRPLTGTLWNLYGPTETTVWASGSAVNDARIHLGQPLANTQLHVLDEHQRPVPPGVMGELWVGGEALALGYWRRPELTASQFRTVEGLPRAGRLYRTGDRVRRTHRGILTHHGRLDFQVKLRGYRIELGEIEAVLAQQPGVDDAVVMVREDPPGEPTLVAYVIADPSSESALVAALRERLPGYMVPSRFVFLDAFPKTGSNKVNRKALPAPERLRHAEAVAPRNPTEARLVDMFQDLLKITGVGIHDDFFEIGGHSLLAVRLTAAIHQAFGVEIPVSLLVQHNTPALLADVLKRDGAVELSVKVTLRQGQEAQPLWLVHPIGGNVFCYRELTRQLAPWRPVMAFQSPGLVQDDGAEVSVETIAACYVASLLESQPEGPYLLGGWCFGGAVAYEMARQLRQRGARVEGLALIDSRAPIEANVPDDADDATLLSWFARDLAVPYGKPLILSPHDLRQLPDDEKFEHVLAAAKALDVLAPDARSEDVLRYFETYMANGIALRAYFPPPEDIPLLLLKARDETEDFGPHLGWDALARGPFRQVDLPGDHNSIVRAPQVQAVAREIDSRFPRQALSGGHP